jgi:sulfate adenylyltransferase
MSIIENEMTNPFMNVMKNRFCMALILLILPLSFVQAKDENCELPSITLSQRQLCDLELILNGGFYPLEGFMDSKTYNRVVEEMRLPVGTAWPIPIVLDVNEKIKEKIKDSKRLALRNPEGVVIANMDISEIWSADKNKEALNVYGTVNTEHPGVTYLFKNTGEYYVGGKVNQVNMPRYFDFTELRKTPAELKAYFKELGITKILGFQTHQPMHKIDCELTNRAIKEIGGHLLIHPVVGTTMPDDVDHFTRVKCYKKVLNNYCEGGVTLSLLPLSMRMAGPREALWQAIISRNYGCTHFFVGKDDAGCGKDNSGKEFYEPYAAQKLVLKYANDVGIIAIPLKEMGYVLENACYEPIENADSSHTILNYSHKQLMNSLREDKEIPSWFTFSEVITELKKIYPPRPCQGMTLFFTGFSGAGKSTIANALAVKLMEIQDRPVTILDGDLVRHHLSSELGFSKEHRSLNVRRVGFVSSEITKNRGVAICAMIAPYEEDRSYNRHLISSLGNYIEIYVSTSLSECEARDPKGLYEKARNGLIPVFTGISDPYEIPKNPELVIDTAEVSVSNAVELILGYLANERYINITKQ